MSHLECPQSASVTLGLTLRRQRLSRGWSLRVVAQKIGFSSHTSLIDYEKGRRIPPSDLLEAFEKALEFPPGHLPSLRAAALFERANRLCIETPSPPSPPQSRLTKIFSIIIGLARHSIHPTA
jgi:transcriptional regulator with XRE-family HTH domain